MSNEIIVMGCTYTLFCFTDWVEEAERYWVGDVLMYMLGFNVLFNFSILLFAQISYVINEFKRRRHANKLKKAL